MSAVQRPVNAIGNGSWPALNRSMQATAGAGRVPGAAVEAVDLDLVGWFQQRFAQAPPTAEQLAEWQRLARAHRADPQRGWLCRTCAVAHPCVFRVLAHAAVAAVQPDEAEFDADPVVRFAARMVAAQRAEEGYAAMMLPLLTDAVRIVTTHRPDPDGPGVCPVCSTGAPVCWPCRLHGLAARVVQRFDVQLPGQVGRNP